MDVTDTEPDEPSDESNPEDPISEDATDGPSSDRDTAGTGADSSNHTSPGLWRSSQDRYLGGVAGGIAERFGLDPFAPRAAFLATSLFTAYAADWVAVIPFFYLVLWLVLPLRGGPAILRSLGSRAGLRQAAGAIAWFVVVALMLSRPALGFALALAAAAWALLRDDHDGPVGGLGGPADSDRVADPAAPDMSPMGPATDQRTTAFADIDSVPTAPTSARRIQWGRNRRAERGDPLVAAFGDRRPRTRRQPALWPLTIALLAMLALGGAVAEEVLDPGVDPGIMVNLALIVIGAVILLSAWRGRALWTVVLAIALLPAWVGFSVADIGRFDGVGTASHTPRSVPASGELAYENGLGTMTVDLRELPLGEGDHLGVSVASTAGEIRVYAPFDADVIVRSKIGLGTSRVSGYGVGFYEYDAEPYVDRYVVRRYGAHGAGCIDDYWATWEELVAQHRRAGAELQDLSADDAQDVAGILQAIETAGFGTPTRVDSTGPDPFPGGDEFYTIIDEFGNEIAVLPEGAVFAEGQPMYTVIDEFGNEIAVLPRDAVFGDERGSAAAPPIEPIPPRVTQQSSSAESVAQQTWSYPASPDGAPCVETPPPDDPVTIELDATIGIGTLEVIRNDY